MNSMKQSLAICLSVLLIWAMMPHGADAEFGWRRRHRTRGRKCTRRCRPTIWTRWWLRLRCIRTHWWRKFWELPRIRTRWKRPTRFVKANPNLTGDPLQQAAQNEEWDPSVMALLQFPSVLEKLAQNLGWTSALGDVSANQQAT